MSDPKRPYGGLVPSQPKGTRAYQDAATYNHHLAQHQAYTAHAQAQAATTFRNPYVTPQNAQQPHRQQQPQLPGGGYNMVPDQAYPQQLFPSNQTGPTQQHRLLHQTSTGQLSVNSGTAHNQGLPSNSQVHLNPKGPPNTFNANARARANTINHMKEIPPALARLHRIDNIPRDALTPVLNRDDAMQEWERRQAGKQGSAPQSYPQIEYLQQQAEMAAASGLPSWTQSHNRYPAPPSKLSHSYHPQTIMIDDENGRRDVVMSNVRTTSGRSEGANMYGGSGPAVISNPPQTYASNTTTSGNRYAATYAQAPTQQQQPSGAVGFEASDRRPEVGNPYGPMQADQYQSYGTSGAQHVAVPAQTVAPSFYGAGVVATGQVSGGQAQPSQQRTAFPVTDLPMSGPKEARRGGGGGSMDSWTR